VFFTALATALLVTEQAQCLLQALLSDGGSNDVVVAAIGAAALLFTSEGAGFVLSSLWMFWWYLRAGKSRSFSGYSLMWSDLAYDIKKQLTDRLSSQNRLASQLETEQPLWALRLEDYSADVYLSYFWQQAPAELVQWVSRRVTTYLICMSACTATAVAVGTSSAMIQLLGFGWTGWNWLILFLECVLAFIFYFDGKVAYREGFHMLELWETAMFEPELRTELTRMERDSGLTKET
jgi:hypothetical protein